MEPSKRACVDLGGQAPILMTHNCVPMSISLTYHISLCQNAHALASRFRSPCIRLLVFVLLNHLGRECNQKSQLNTFVGPEGASNYA